MVVQQDSDEEKGPMYSVYGTMDADLEVQCTIKKGALTAFLRLLIKIIGPTTSPADNEGIIDGLWMGKMECVGPKAKDADL